MPTYAVKNEEVDERPGKNISNLLTTVRKPKKTRTIQTPIGYKKDRLGL